ncbi:MAG: SDR family oxidoreductase [Hyphomicrobiales bacterium]|nr:MAG: SDR family oxidoreductase [Hyphomicrobiales bacterium]
MSTHHPGPEWHGRKVLITGGTSGTGLEAARQMVTQGAQVVVVGRDTGRGAAACEELQRLADAGGGAHLAIGDCASYDDSARVVAEAVATLGTLDALISAGATGEGDPKPFADMSPNEIERGLATRFLARVQPVHAAIPHLRDRESASVVLLTTDAARHATRGESIIGAYAASIIAFTKTLARELASDKVRVNSVSMTLTSGTKSWDHIFNEDSYQHDLFSKALDRFPLGAAPTAREVADAVVFLASPRAAQVTGQTLSVNGGLSFGGW